MTFNTVFAHLNPLYSTVDSRHEDHKNKSRKTVDLDLRRGVSMNCDHAHDHQGRQENNQQLHHGEEWITNGVLR